MITRDEILRRARAVPLRSDWYSQSRLDGDGANAQYRPDCSGWVSYCWGLPTSGAGTWGGYNTSTLVTLGIMYEIPRSELQPGDAIGYCGPTTGGNGGHIALWLRKSGSREWILDHGGGLGPNEHVVTWGIPGDAWNSAGKIKAFRFRGVEGATGGGDEFLMALTSDQQADVWRRTGSIQRQVFDTIVPALAASKAREESTLLAIGKLVEAAGGDKLDTDRIVAAVDSTAATAAAVAALTAQVEELTEQLADRDARLAAALTPAA